MELRLPISVYCWYTWEDDGYVPRETIIMIEVNNCPVCGASSFKEVFKAPWFRGDNREFQIVECNSCSFWITNPRPDDEELGFYYNSENYISHNNSNRGLMDKVYQMVRSYSLKRKLRLIQSQDNGSKKLLDYGAGTGHFLKVAKQAGWEVSGVEVSEDARKIAKADNDLDLLDASEIRWVENSYSVISLWHVLEHLPDLNDHLNKFFTALEKGGALIIAVPNHESADAKHYGNSWAALDVPLHLWHFKKENISRLAQKHGFELSQILNMPFDSFYVSLLSEKIENHKSSPFSAFLNGLRSNLKGKSDKNMSSLIYVLKKP